MLWAALRLSAPADTTPPPHDDACAGLATWALQFTPRVVRVQNAVLMEVEASVRLFGGRRALHLRVGQEARELGVTDLAWAPTGQGALALATAGVDNGLCEPLDSLLDSLPMQALGAVLPHAPTLAQLGCRTLGDVRHLPRGGLSRRFGPDLLIALDQAYGLRAESYRWVELPEIFQAKVELMARVETAPALLFGARRLLLQLAGWLAARHCGVTALTLSWVFDSMRPRDAGPGGELTVRTAKPLRDVEHLSRLLAEHLAQVQLAAPVESLALHAVEVHPLQQHSRSLLPDPQHAAESLALALERITARLGESRVQRPVLVEDARPEWSQRWQTASLPLPRLAAAPDGLPQPTFLLPEPLRLATRNHRPLHQGELQLLLGPHRVEGGWWHRAVQDGQDVTLHVARDYWVALSAHAGVLWLFQTRLAQDETAWFLHGVFA
ncbi:MAG: DNA polymerase Y family protein [Thiomonas sp.]